MTSNIKPGLFRIFVYITVLTVFLSAVTVFNEYNRYLELFSHFRLQYLLASICLLSIAIYLKWKITSAILILTAITNIYLVFPWYISENTKLPGSSSVSFKILHANVLTSNTNHERFLNLVQTEKPNIIVVQEVDKKWIGSLTRLESKYPYSHTVPRSDNFGLAIYSQHPISKITPLTWGNFGLPSLLAEISINNQTIRLFTTHPVPPIGESNYLSRNKQLLDAASYIAQTPGPKILVGDLNISMWAHHYRPLESTANLVNTRKGFGVLPSWPKGLFLNQIPIDHCLVSTELTVLNTRTGPSIGSDHLPLIVELALNPPVL